MESALNKEGGDPGPGAGPGGVQRLVITIAYPEARKVSGLLLEEGTLRIGQVVKAGPYGANFLYTGSSKMNPKNQFERGDTIVEVNQQVVQNDVDLINKYTE